MPGSPRLRARAHWDLFFWKQVLAIAASLSPPGHQVISELGECRGPGRRGWSTEPLGGAVRFQPVSLPHTTTQAHPSAGPLDSSTRWAGGQMREREKGVCVPGRTCI